MEERWCFLALSEIKWTMKTAVNESLAADLVIFTTS